MDCALSLCATRHNWDFVQSWPRVPVSHEHQKSLVRNTDSGLLPHPSPAPSRLITSGKKEMRTGLGAEVGQAGNSKQTHHGYRGQGHSGGKSPSRRNWGEQTACWVCGDPGWDSPQQCRERSALLCLGPPKPQMTKVQCSCPAPPHRADVGSHLGLRNHQALPALGTPWTPRAWHVSLIDPEDDTSSPQLTKPQVY